MLPGAAVVRSVVGPVRIAVACVRAVLVANEGVVVVDVDFAVSPAGAPGAAPGRAHGYTDTEGEGHRADGIVVGRGIVDRRVRVVRRAVNHRRVVLRYVHHFGILLLDHDHLLLTRRLT